jgi:hypothetical protein
MENHSVDKAGSNNKNNTGLGGTTMDEELEFVVGGARVRVSRLIFVDRLAGIEPEPIRKYGVEIAGKRYPIKQAVSLGLAVPRAGFQTQEAFRVLRRLGFDPAE